LCRNQHMVHGALPPIACTRPLPAITNEQTNEAVWQQNPSGLAVTGKQHLATLKARKSYDYWVIIVILMGYSRNMSKGPRLICDATDHQEGIHSAPVTENRTSMHCKVSVYEVKRITDNKC